MKTQHAQSNGDDQGAEESDFVDAQPERTPPAIAARDKVSRNHKLSPGAKWFFSFLTDSSYLRSLGGDGRGRITIPVTELKSITGHDRKSFTKWVKELVAHNFLWLERHRIPNAYAVNVYCVAALVPSNEKPQGAGLAIAWGRWRGAKGKFSPPPEEAAEETPETSETPSPQTFFSLLGKESPSQGPLSPPPMGKNATSQGPLSPPPTHRSSHLPRTVSSSSEVALTGRGRRKVSPREAETFPTGGGGNGSGEVARTVRFKETPSENRRQKDMKGGPTPPVLREEVLFKKWEAGLEKQFPPELRLLKADLKSDLAKPQSEVRRAFVRRKLKAVEERLTGPQPDDVPAPKNSQPAKVKRKPISLAKGRELLAKARKQHGV